jgi:nucleolar protein 14
LVASLSEKGVRKAKPQDPLKSEEDIAKFEAERLFQLERMRLKRMHGEIGEDEVDISSSNKKKRKRDDKPKRAPVREHKFDSDW